ncbi:MAG: hypothetical protein RIA65_03295 [Woeseia sp.]
MTARTTRYLVAFSLLFSSLAVAERVPATFEHPEDALLPRIEFPDLRGDATATLQCASQVKASGRMEENGCYVKAAGDEVFIKAILLAAKKARMTPARVNGKAISVYVQFQVEFRKAGDEQTIRIMNNPGLQENIEAYGDEHIAAQRGLTAERWQKECPKRVRFTVWAKAHVATDGTQSNFSILPGDGAPITERCSNAIIATLTESEFTPAYADGEPVPSSFIEPFGS